VEGSLVLDANTALALALPLPYSSLATEAMQQWQVTRTKLYVPALWCHEVTSGLRKAMLVAGLAQGGAEAALASLMALGVVPVMPTVELQQSCLQWSLRLGRPVACDSAYVALAESPGCELWMADRKPVQAAIRTGVTWVRWLGDCHSTSLP
jgi:predicted nucleic acid-binding protein